MIKVLARFVGVFFVLFVCFFAELPLTHHTSQVETSMPLADYALPYCFMCAYRCRSFYSSSTQWMKIVTVLRQRLHVQIGEVIKSAWTYNPPPTTLPQHPPPYPVAKLSILNFTKETKEWSVAMAIEPSTISNYRLTVICLQLVQDFHSLSLASLSVWVLPGLQRNSLDKPDSVLLHFVCGWEESAASKVGFTHCTVCSQSTWIFLCKLGSMSSVLKLFSEVWQLNFKRFPLVTLAAASSLPPVQDGGSSLYASTGTHF